MSPLDNLIYKFIIFEVLIQIEIQDESTSLLIFHAGTQYHPKWEAKCHWSIDKLEINAMHLHRRYGQC